MKKILVACVSLVGLTCLGLIAVFYFTSGLVETADNFFARVAERDMDAAHDYLAHAFKAETSTEELSSFLEDSELNKYERARWNSRSVNLNSGTLDGAVVTSSGAEIPLKVTLTREEGAWKIYSIERPTGGLIQSVSDLPKLPTAEEAQALVRSVTELFADAVHTEDFSKLHAATATPFQQKYTAVELRELFAAYINQKIDLRVLANHVPLFTVTPALSAAGQLHLEGYYPTRPSRAHFSYDFLKEAGTWRLIAIDFEVRPSTDS